MACLGKLLLHYPMTNMTEREKTLLLEDYIEDLSRFPAWALAEVCRQYRLDAENQFFPKVAVLVEMLRKTCRDHEKIRCSIRNILGEQPKATDSHGTLSVALELAAKLKSGRPVL